MSQRTKLMTGSFCLLLIFAASRSEAEIMPGVRAGAYFDANSAFVGGEVLGNITHSWYFNPNLEYVFQDRVRFLTFNFDVHYDIPTREPVYVWVGGGLAILYRNPDNRFLDTETDPGVNILFGVGFNKGGAFVPYIQEKGILSDHSDFSLAFGVRF